MKHRPTLMELIELSGRRPAGKCPLVRPKVNSGNVDEIVTILRAALRAVREGEE